MNADVIENCLLLIQKVVVSLRFESSLGRSPMKASIEVSIFSLSWLNNFLPVTLFHLHLLSTFVTRVLFSSFLSNLFFHFENINALG